MKEWHSVLNRTHLDFWGKENDLYYIICCCSCVGPMDTQGGWGNIWSEEKLCVSLKVWPSLSLQQELGQIKDVTSPTVFLLYQTFLMERENEVENKMLLSHKILFLPTSIKHLKWNEEQLLWVLWSKNIWILRVIFWLRVCGCVLQDWARALTLIGSWFHSWSLLPPVHPQKARIWTFGCYAVGLSICPVTRVCDQPAWGTARVLFL